MGFVLVQHLDPEHDSALTQLLGRATSLPVHEVTDNLRVEPNHVYVIPPSKNLGITAGVLTLGPRPGGVHKGPAPTPIGTAQCPARPHPSAVIISVSIRAFLTAFPPPSLLK
jgi:CheB methylesterase